MRGARVTAIPEAAWSQTAAAVGAALDVDPERGLSPIEVARRKHRFGTNRLRAIEARGALTILRAQMKSAIVLLLVVGAAVSIAFDHIAEGIAIAGVVVLNVIIGFTTELRAVRSMEALRELGEVTTTVRRAGVLRAVSATELVPGDLVSLEAGDVVTADLRLIECWGLGADESVLTGESVPIDKTTEPSARDAALAERRSMLFKGTTVTRGAGEGLVVGTGMSTELGRISALVSEAEDQTTPLERRLEVLGRQLMVVSLVFVVLATVAGVARGMDLLLMAQSAIALAVATVPEGLPVVATVALARGMWRMARRRALIDRLGAVETLGSATLILTDKTGTLTENRLRAVSLMTDTGAADLDGPMRDGSPPELAVRALRVAVMSSDASGGSAGAGDPIEVALVEAGERLDIHRGALLEREPELYEVAFDSDLMMSATVHRFETGVRVAVKGAPEAVLARCTRVVGLDGPRPLDAAARARWADANLAAASRGLRVLAIAERVADRELVDGGVYAELTLLGLVGLLNPPREAVKPVLDAARAAGIRVVMVTGDQAPTATAVAAAVGLDASAVTLGRAIPDESGSSPEVAAALASDVVARASPAEKLLLLRLHQRAGQTVAMLGDGVNDAPALEQADIGVAMGRRGTQVARQAADMVLEDDELGSVLAAIEEGRVIFGNLRAFVVYLLGCNLSEILIIGIGVTIGWPLPVLPLQILYLNLLTDVFPALALGVGEGDASVMGRPPRAPEEPFLTRAHWRAVGAHAALMAAAVLGAFGFAREGLGVSDDAAVTIAFAVLGFAQLFHVFDMSDRASRPWSNEVTRNPWVWAAVALCVVLLAAGLFAPGLSDVLGSVPVPTRGWLVVAIASPLPYVTIQAARLVTTRGDPRA